VWKQTLGFPLSLKTLLYVFLSRSPTSLIVSLVPVCSEGCVEEDVKRGRGPKILVGRLIYRFASVFPKHLVNVSHYHLLGLSLALRIYLLLAYSAMLEVFVPCCICLRCESSEVYLLPCSNALFSHQRCLDTFIPSVHLNTLFQSNADSRTT